MRYAENGIDITLYVILLMRKLTGQITDESRSAGRQIIGITVVCIRHAHHKV